MEKIVRMIVKMKNDAVIPKLRKYGKIIDRFTLIDGVGMDVEEKNISKIRKLKEIEEVREAGVGKAL